MKWGNNTNGGRSRVVLKMNCAGKAHSTHCLACRNYRGNVKLCLPDFPSPFDHKRNFDLLLNLRCEILRRPEWEQPWVTWHKRERRERTARGQRKALHSDTQLPGKPFPPQPSIKSINSYLWSKWIWWGRKWLRHWTLYLVNAFWSQSNK